MSSGANSFGSRFVLTSFGESHGPALGCVIDGCPAGVDWDEALLRHECARRRPGQALEGRPVVVTDRAEPDAPEVLSGVYQGKTLGSPIALAIRNLDARSGDYAQNAARAGHADDVWLSKFGVSDHRGGGRSSGRETVARSMGGAVAQMFLRSEAPSLRVIAFVSQAWTFTLSDDDLRALDARWVAGEKYPADGFVARFPSPAQERGLETSLLDAKTQGLSYGAVVEIWVDGVPAGLGQPVFRKLKSDLAGAFMSVGATAGVEIGEGFSVSTAEGSQFHSRGASPYGGIRGGVSTGERIVARVAFKPTASVMDVAKRGRHDPCIAPRAAPVLEAMTWLTLAEHALWRRSDRAILT